MKKKNSFMLMIVGIISLVLITVGVTYAFFNYVKEGTTDNTITTSTITFLYTEIDKVGAGISIKDAYPISDSQGKMLSGTNEVFDFKITSTTPNTSSIPYEITARKNSDSTLDESAVKLYLTKVVGTTEEEVLLSKYSDLGQTSKVSKDKYTEKTIYTGKVPADSKNYDQAFKLRMWVSSDTNFSPDENDNYPYNGKEFSITVNVYANAKVVTEEDKLLESNNEISSIEVGEKSAIVSYSDDYDYEIGLPSGITETSLNIETKSLDTEVKVEKLDNLAYTSNVKRLNATKSVQVSEGDNYFKITTTSLTGEKRESIINVRVGEYRENLLNGTDPVLTSNLVPVVIKDDGKVYKVDTNYTWYDYETKYWANAVVLRKSDTYKVGELIDEDDIQSYFVWIPKYSYQLWDLGNYSSLTSLDTTKPHAIPIRFGLTNTSDANTGECTTPGVAGESGKCKVGDYMTHPAFLAFNTNGLWVGKFETGYDGAAIPSEAATDVNIVDTSKIIIKPNSYSWRNINLGNAFKNSYDYLRSDDSHMMKNTEWGAVAYLSHSLYGTCEEIDGQVKCFEVRINNNNNFITGYSAVKQPSLGNNKGISIEENLIEGTSLTVDGNYTINYLNNSSVSSSTSRNYTGIYDMSGGAWEYVMGYTSNASTEGGSSEISTLYDNFYTNDIYIKYYDVYSSTITLDYSNRILGDATGEMGSFFSETDPDNTSRQKNSWYDDCARFAYSSSPWFTRGGNRIFGTNAGLFTFYGDVGQNSTGSGFRIVLAPTK